MAPAAVTAATDSAAVTPIATRVGSAVTAPSRDHRLPAQAAGRQAPREHQPQERGVDHQRQHGPPGDPDHLHHDGRDGAGDDETPEPGPGHEPSQKGAGGEEEARGRRGPRIGVSTSRRPPAGSSVPVSAKNGHRRPPPTHQGGEPRSGRPANACGVGVLGRLIVDNARDGAGLRHLACGRRWRHSVLPLPSPDWLGDPCDPRRRVACRGRCEVRRRHRQPTRYGFSCAP